ncbi:hypothetical protein [Nonomuraea sp. NPDC046570]|uniref:hypothetical protein n=1 Tax=Nonomuraea sp. NPDC046570 TaxID=3155255 RepID=UPI0033E87A90
MDYTPDDIVFRDGKAAALIDCDIAKLIARVDEVADAMMCWSPLCDPRRRRPAVAGDGRAAPLPDPGRRLRDVRRPPFRLVEVFALRTRRAWFLMTQ